MKVKWISIIVILVSLLVYVGINVQKPASTKDFSQVENTIRQPIYLGAWVGGFWDSKTKTLDVSAFEAFEKTIDHKLAIANLFSEWTYLARPEFVQTLHQISDKDWIPMVSSNPLFFEKCPKGEHSLYRTIANGDCDEFFEEVAFNFKAYGKPVFFRFAWEMNLPNIYWSVDHVESTPDDFKEAWRRFYTIMEKNQVENVIWVLSFNTSSKTTIPYKELYPGDKYVDWVAIDGYNWGNTRDWSKWTHFDGVFYNSYAELIAITKKPVMLSEVNSVSSGGNKSEWLKDMLVEQIPYDYPQIEAVVLFNEDKSQGEGVDWRIETSQDNVEAVKEAINNPRYRSSYP